MGRRPHNAPLRVYLNNRRVGTLTRDTSGGIGFRYHDDWLSWDHALPISLSLPVRETPYKGNLVSAVFENLLPDSDIQRRRVAEKVGARRIDAYNMLSKIGHDCVGALQFVTGDDTVIDSTRIFEGEAIDDAAVEQILKGLGQAPLGLYRDDAFRISVAGAQEKTALLYRKGQWLRPHGPTPTTHLLKTQIGQLPGGIDLSDSVENEFLCLKLTEAFGLPVNPVQIATFGDTKAIVIERFDRRWTQDERLLRLPQEDCCQALSVPPTLKYQSDGGPSIVAILDLLRGSDVPIEDQDRFFKAQMIFWLIGATDGHAKNFSLFIGPGGSYRMTPLYDILTAQPALESRQIERKHFKLAMSVGKNRHYRVDKIHGRHFLQTGARAGLSTKRMQKLVEEIVEIAPWSLEAVMEELPAKFPPRLYDAVRYAVIERLRGLKMPDITNI